MRTASIEHASSVLKSWRYDDEGKVKMTVQYNPRREYSTLLIQSVSAHDWLNVFFSCFECLLHPHKTFTRVVCKLKIIVHVCGKT